MTRQEMQKNILRRFEASAKEYTQKTNGIFCDIDSEYKGEEEIDNLKSRSARISYLSFAVEFKYRVKGLWSLSASILECLIYYDKSPLACPIPLPIVTDYLGISTASMLCIPYITNGEGMKQAFASIESVLTDILPRLEEICSDREKKADLLRHFIHESEYVFKIEFPMTAEEFAKKSVCEPDDEVFYPDEHFYEYITFRFSSTCFINYLKGKKKKAIKELEKQKLPFGYERRVLEIWKSEEEPQMPDLSAIVPNLDKIDTNGAEKADLKELASLFVSWLVLSLACAPAYLAVFFLLYFLEGRSSVYLMGPIYNFPYCIMAGFITAIALSYFTRLKFYKLLFKRHYENYEQMDGIMNGKGSDKFMRGFAKLVIAASLVLCVLLSKWNVNFMADGFVDNTKFLSLRGEYYSYSEIDHVYYKPYLVNGLGERLDNPSYVIVMKDGREIDLYEFEDTEICEEKIIGYLEDKGVEIVGNEKSDTAFSS